MYHIAVSFDVPADRRDDFIAAALEDGRDSNREEPGTQRFELIVDGEHPNRFYLNEACDYEEGIQVNYTGGRFVSDYHIIEHLPEGAT